MTNKQSKAAFWLALERSGLSMAQTMAAMNELIKSGLIVEPDPEETVFKAPVEGFSPIEYCYSSPTDANMCAKHNGLLNHKSPQMRPSLVKHVGLPVCIGFVHEYGCACHGDQHKLSNGVLSMNEYDLQHHVKVLLEDDFMMSSEEAQKLIDAIKAEKIGFKTLE